MLNHLMTFEKIDLVQWKLQKVWIIESFCLQRGQSAFSAIPYVNSPLFMTTILCSLLSLQIFFTWEK